MPPSSSASTPAGLALAALFGGAVAIAFAPIFVRLSELGPVATACHRLLLALPVLWLWAALEAPLHARPGARHRRPRGRADHLRLALAGLCFAGDLALWHWSIRLTSVANATLLANAAPIFVALGGWLLFAQRFTGTFIVGMLLALAGAAVLMGQSLSLDPGRLAGDALGLLTALFYAGYILAVGRLRGEFSTATIMAWSGAVTALVLLPLAWLSGETLLATTLHGWLVLLGLALLSHTCGQSLIAYALAHLPAAFSSVGLLLQPAVAALLAWLLLAEPLSAWQALGGAVILAGIVVARRGSRPPPAVAPLPTG
ncbi:MAG TPA: DMT family transporter [Gammaproteobacteria bacterium]